MAYYRICPDCGCNLDPGEECDCRKERKRQRDFYRRTTRTEPETRQVLLANTTKTGRDEYGYAETS